MRVFYGFDSLPAFRHPVATTGSFDGVHGGHRMLLERVAAIARDAGGESVVMTFEPHPRLVLGGGVRLLTTLDEKLDLLSRAGADNTIVIPFDREFSRLDSHTFLAEYVAGRIGSEYLAVGYNHRFGHGKEGDFAYLQRVRDEWGLAVMQIDEFDEGDEKVSSTVIRHLVEEGSMEHAARLLSHRYTVMGIVADGRMTVADEHKLLPPDGTYRVTVGGTATEARIDGRNIELAGAAEGKTTINF
ncbi:MAG: FAD synthetase [Alistipes sp.]|nr:FAD synthetase [Alistipes sp.]